MSTATVAPIVTYAPTRPVEVVPQLQQVSRGHISIISIWPAPLVTKRRHNGITYYNMAAAPRGSYSKLVVYDTQEWVNTPSESKSQGEMGPRAIPALVVAQCLVSTWAGDTLGAKSGHKPGIGFIVGDDPTVAELKALRDTQSALFNWYITDAMGKHMSGEGVNISDTHRLGAREMLDKGAERLPWFPVVDFAAVKDCIACGKQINENALRCEHCTTMLPNFYMDFGIDPVGDPVVKAFMERIRLSKENAALKAEQAQPTKKDLEPRLAQK